MTQRFIVLLNLPGLKRVPGVKSVYQDKNICCQDNFAFKSHKFYLKGYIGG